MAALLQANICLVQALCKPCVSLVQPLCKPCSSNLGTPCLGTLRSGDPLVWGSQVWGRWLRGPPVWGLLGLGDDPWSGGARSGIPISKND